MVKSVSWAQAFTDADKKDWLKKMPVRFKGVCRAIKQGRLKGNRWVSKLNLPMTGKEEGTQHDEEDEPDSEAFLGFGNSL